MGEVEHVNVENENIYHIDLDCIVKGTKLIIESCESIGCGITYHEKICGLHPKYDSNFKRTTPSIHIAGNTTGISSINDTFLTGEIATVSVIESLNATNPNKAMEEKK